MSGIKLCGAIEIQNFSVKTNANILVILNLATKKVAKFKNRRIIEVDIVN